MWKIILLSCALAHCVFSSISIEKTHTPEAEVAAQVVYDSETKSAFYVDSGADSTKPCLFRYDTVKKVTYSAYVKGSSLGKPGFIIPIESGHKLEKFVVGFSNFVAVVYWDGKSGSAKLGRELYNQADRMGPTERIGYGGRDQSGHSIYSGTMTSALCGPKANQSSYVKQRGHDYRPIITGLKLPSGWSVANGYVYVLDSCTGKIWEIPNTKCDGPCGKPHVAFNFNSICTDKCNKELLPLGLASDLDGNLFTVNYYDGSIYKIDLVSGKAKKVCKLPTGYVTSLSFGGENGQDMYLTVARKQRDVPSGVGLTARQTPGTALYKVKGLGAGPLSKRVKV